MTRVIAMDNQLIHVVGGFSDEPGEPDDLMPTLQLAFNHHSVCAGWSVKDGQLKLYWHRSKDATPTASPLSLRETHSLVVGWLRANPPKDEYNDSDVHEYPNGFEASTNEWGHGLDDSYCMLAIKPRTCWAGK